MVKLAPSMICADFSRLAEEIHALEEAGADLLHWDVMDGRFVPNITFGMMVVRSARRCTGLPFDVHLMVEDAAPCIDQFAAAGAQWISVHAEACTHLHRAIATIRAAGCHPGVAINPHTPPETLRYILPDIDFVNVMTVNPGFAGQHFIETMLPKIAELKRMAVEGGLDLTIEVDGGMSPEVAPRVVEAGASMLVCGGSSVFLPDRDYRDTIAAMRESASRDPR